MTKIAGEVDSFGAEWHYLCQACLDAERAQPAQPAPDTSGQCDWCKNMAAWRKPRRDYDEGSCGRVYYVCRPCIDKDNARIAAELDEYDSGRW